MSEQNKAQRKFPAAVIVGAVTVLLAIIGLITVVTACVRLGARLLDNSAEKERFEQTLFPVVMFDPGAIESVEELDQLVLLRSSIWAAFTGNMEKYTLDSSNRITVAKSDVDVACAKLFGPEITLEHQSFSDYMSTYFFDEERQSYLAPMDSTSVLYTPQVEDIDHSGVIYTLRVGYMESGNEWLQSLQGRDYEPTPDKYMIYTLKKVDEHFQLVSIAFPEDGAVPGKPVYAPQPTDETLPPESAPTEQPTEQPTEGETNKETI